MNAITACAFPTALFECIYTLAQRFIPTRAFPDKAIELLDISCSKASLKKAKTLDCDYIYQSISRYLPAAHRHRPARSPGPLPRPARLPEGGRGQSDQRPGGNRADHQAGEAGNGRQRDEDRREFSCSWDPTGIGKSFVAARIAEYLFGSPGKTAHHRSGRIQESRGRGKTGQRRRRGRRPALLISEIENHPFSVILFENIEEAHSSVLYFLGKILSKGEIVDRSRQKALPGQHHFHIEPDRHRRGEKGIGHRFCQGRSPFRGRSSSPPRS